ncbi:alpha/beta hydrolase [Pseudoduganella chitinolytica]|uniref:Alpha/beta hydrolase n=1 Tax=Pseudoduganella chitinolytica TaxID=34070 RepID=A0ABY8BEZ3_9BURK|nr:alpha/beta hydrolase [Pseudoduganella chitinolytica]WEF33546.1 alpha/beta hydrolase [Pseudoduganella chitinolytica]
MQDTYVSNVHVPSLTVARADARHANGAAVVIAPGGGHRMLVFQNEGMLAAQHLNRVGVTAFVLKYRLARDGASPYSIEGDAAADLRRAVRWVRAHATEYGVDPRRIGVMGFSAGGELVTLVADNPAPPGWQPRDAVDRLSARPDFQVLVYPGPLGVPAKAAAGAPPAFIVAGSRDKCCMPPALGLYQQLVAAGVSAELHLYADTDHAFNMGQRGERVALQHWPDRLADWLADGGWLVPRDDRPPEGVPAP